MVTRTATLSRGVIVAALTLFAAATALPGAAVGPLTTVVAATGLLAGLPHGSVDHLLASRAFGRSVVMVSALYAVIAAVSWVVLYVAGPLAIGAVVLFSIVHFGTGELEVQRGLTGWRPGRMVSAALVIAATGALILPLARSGDEVQGVAAAVSPGLGTVLGAASVQLALAVLWAGAAVVAGFAASRAGAPIVAVDLALVGLLGAFVPPLAAFAVWFGGWHALRHTGRLLTLESGCAALLAAGRTGDAVRRLIRLAAWPTIAATAVLVVLVGVAARSSAVEPTIAEMLRLLLALTVPHMVIVAWLDHRSEVAPAAPSPAIG